MEKKKNRTLIIGSKYIIKDKINNITKSITVTNITEVNILYINFENNIEEFSFLSDIEVTDFIEHNEKIN